jgi:hypothetical protein
MSDNMQAAWAAVPPRSAQAATTEDRIILLTRNSPFIPEFSISSPEEFMDYKQPTGEL